MKTYRKLTELHETPALREVLASGVGAVALAAENSRAWLAADFACLTSRRACVPLPHFFTQAQMRWVIDSAGVRTVLTDKPDGALWRPLGFQQRELMPIDGLYCWERETERVLLPLGTAKITFTSGSTGQPKGVCLSQSAQETVAQSIANILRELGVQRHLCALPLPVLLENIAGAYAATLAGIECVIPSLSAVGWRGAQQWDAAAFLQCVAESRAESCIILPQMLKALLPLMTQFDIASLKLVAVGGARVAPDLLRTAQQQGLPVYEGYGLSECCSVVCLNLPRANKVGTAGKPLSHAEVRINAMGELEVAGNHFLGYLGQEPSQIDDWLPTGDLASIDEEGFVCITGRCKNVIVSSYGRNISPEWVESELLSQTGVLQAAVFGEAQAFLVAVIFAPTLSASELQHAVEHANQALPDYAQVKKFLRTDKAFTLSNGLATSNGRNKREAIAEYFQMAMDQLYLVETL